MKDPIRSVTGNRSGGYTIRFGTNTVKKADWDGAFPVEVHRINVIDGEAQTFQKRRSLKPSTLDRAIRDMAAGWAHRATESWVELRTPADRRDDG